VHHTRRGPRTGPVRYTRPGISPSLDPVHRTSIRSAHAGLRHHTGPAHHAIHLGLVCRTTSPPLNPGIRLAPAQRRDQPFYPDQSSLDCLDTDSSILVRTGGLLTPSRPVRLVCPTRPDHRTRPGRRPDRPRPDEADRSTPSAFRTGPPDCSPDCSPDRSTAPDRTASDPDCWTTASDRSASSSGSNRTASDRCFRSRYSRSSRDARDPPQPNSDISWLRPGSTPNRSSNAAISSNATSSDIGTVVDAMMVLPLSVGGGPPVWSPRATLSFSVTM